MPLPPALGTWLLTVLSPLLLLLPTGAPLEQRLTHWPQWQLPAPLPRPGRSDLEYPAWFTGQWQVTVRDPDGVDPELRYTVRFREDSRGAVVGDRAFNARAVGRALLGEALLAVANDPANPNRQIARLSDDRRLESTVVGRSSYSPDGDSFLADELALQILHGPGDPRVSRVETLCRYRRLGKDRIEAEQWQASYGSPSEGLTAEARRSWRGQLLLLRIEAEEDNSRGG
jgi:hypothetical protein